MSKQLGAKLKQLRIESGLTQTYVGAKLNIGNKTISDYERGISEPDTTVLKELARLYGISIDELLDNEPINSTTSGERLKELRIEKRLTLRELADKLSMSYSNIAMIERGERNFSSDSLKSFCDFFNVSSDYLLGLTTTHPKNELTDELHNTIDKLNKGNKEFILKLAKTLIKEQ